jgi:tRNA(adenine34) deaminase
MNFSELETAAMMQALELARVSAVEDEVPVGAVVVRTQTGEIIGRGRDRKMTLTDPTAHAEIMAMREAAEALGDWRLEGCTLVVTLEPCPMCAGAAIMARLDGVIFGAPNPKFGATGSLVNLPGDARWNHQLPVSGGLMAEECGQVLSDYFRAKRGRGARE